MREKELLKKIISISECESDAERICSEIIENYGNAYSVFDSDSAFFAEKIKNRGIIRYCHIIDSYAQTLPRRRCECGVADEITETDVSVISGFGTVVYINCTYHTLVLLESISPEKLGWFLCIAVVAGEVGYAER
jgi:hypothetical protein